MSKEQMHKPAPLCPTCSKPAHAANTRYGIRHSCCGLHSWDGKPLVSQEVHDARKVFHGIFDRLWETAEAAYKITEPKGSPEHFQAVKRIRRAARNRTYQYISAISGLPEPECHGSTQEDLKKLALITRVAKACTGPAEVRTWWKEREKETA